jgi:hypothetical protein
VKLRRRQPRAPLDYFGAGSAQMLLMQLSCVLQQSAAVLHFS